MYRFDIITKTGILVFSHDFKEEWLEGEEDHDLFAGLKSAAITALRETQGETITEIKQIGFTLILYEGILTYGILTVKEPDNRLHGFLRSLVLKFELMFTVELHTTSVFRKEDFETFRITVNTSYLDFITDDYRGLNRIIDIVSQLNAFNFIVYSPSTFKPLYTSMIDLSKKLPLQKITYIFRNLDNLCLLEKKNSITVEIDLEDIIIHLIRTKTHWIVCVSDSDKTTKYTLRYEINLLKNILSDVPILTV